MQEHGGTRLTKDDIPRLRNIPVLTADGEEVGHVGDVYYDEASGRVECVGVPGDAIGFTNVMVPVGGAELVAGELRLRYTRDQLRDFGDRDERDELDADRWGAERDYYGGLARIGAGAPAGPTSGGLSGVGGAGMGTGRDEIFATPGADPGALDADTPIRREGEALSREGEKSDEGALTYEEADPADDPADRRSARYRRFDWDEPLDRLRS